MNTGFYITTPVRRAPWFSYVLAAIAGLACVSPFFLFVKVMPGILGARDEEVPMVFSVIIAGGVAVYHGLAGSLFGFFWPMKRWRWGLYMNLVPALLYSFFAPVGPPYLLFTLVTFAPACAGSSVGSRMG